MTALPAQNAPDKDQVALVQRWRAMIDTQMRFNDMHIRTRSNRVSIVIAVIGTAAVSNAHYPERDLTQ
jgi:hypothetical protein